MDKLRSFGTAIAKIVGPTSGVFVPLLMANKSAILSTPRKTFQYGPTDRQYLDIYQSPTTGHDSPILIFLYGGGFAVGSKAIPQIPDGLVYANLGHFFAEKYGYTVVIPDYRLIQHGAKYPSGGQDLALVIEWIKSHLMVQQEQQRRRRNLFLMGNSAGGVHVATYLLDPEFATSRKSLTDASTAASLLSLRGAILVSTPFDFAQAEPDRKETLQAYYGAAERIATDCPLGLLQAAGKRQQHGLELFSTTATNVKLLVLSGTLDPEDEVLAPQERFLTEWRRVILPQPEKRDSILAVGVMEGHNHISPTLSLGTGLVREEAWGRYVGGWCTSILSP